MFVIITSVDVTFSIR